MRTFSGHFLGPEHLARENGSVIVPKVWNLFGGFTRYSRVLEGEGASPAPTSDSPLQACHIRSPASALASMIPSYAPGLLQASFATFAALPAHRRRKRGGAGGGGMAPPAHIAGPPLSYKIIKTNGSASPL